MKRYLAICAEYEPKEGSKTCRNYQKHDICRRADRVLCSVALSKRDAEEAGRAKEDVQLIHEHLGHTRDPRPGYQPFGQGEVSEAKRLYRSHLGSPKPPWRQGAAEESAGESDDGPGLLGLIPASQSPSEPLATPSPAQECYEQPRVRQAAPQPLVEHPELLTMESVDQLASLGLEACLETRGGEVWLVPSYTDQDRHELSYQDARTLVIVMQAFPGSSLTHIARPVPSGAVLES